MIILQTYGLPPVPVGFLVRQGFNQRMEMDLIKMQQMKVDHRTFSIQTNNETSDILKFNNQVKYAMFISLFDCLSG